MSVYMSDDLQELIDPANPYGQEIILGVAGVAPSVFIFKCIVTLINDVEYSCNVLDITRTTNQYDVKLSASIRMCDDIICANIHDITKIKIISTLQTSVIDLNSNFEIICQKYAYDAVYGHTIKLSFKVKDI